MAAQTQFPRPNGPIANWSSTQAARWIKAQVKAENVVFRYHAEHERGVDYNVSPDEAREAILKGKSARWEPRENPKTREPTMNMTFTQALRTHTIGVVTSISESDPNVVVVTLWRHVVS